MEPAKQETLISSVHKAVRLLREKANDYRRVIEFETMAVCSMRNICLDGILSLHHLLSLLFYSRIINDLAVDIKDGMERFNFKFQAEGKV